MATATASGSYSAAASRYRCGRARSRRNERRRPGRRGFVTSSRRCGCHGSNGSRLSVPSPSAKLRSSGRDHGSTSPRDIGDPPGQPWPHPSRHRRQAGGRDHRRRRRRARPQVARRRARAGVDSEEQVDAGDGARLRRTSAEPGPRPFGEAAARGHRRGSAADRGTRRSGRASPAEGVQAARDREGRNRDASRGRSRR